MQYMDVKNLQNRQTSNEEKPNNTSKKGWFIAVPAALVILAIVLVVVFNKNVQAFFNPVSIVANASNSTQLKETDGRTNILLLGSDKRSIGTVTSQLTDTIIVASIENLSGDVNIISVPRDLWVESTQGDHTKINALYTYGGADEVSATLEKVLGIPIHYYAVVNFDLFEEVVNTLGGVDVNVANTFDDYQYPVEGKENAPDNERYQHIHFNAGLQKMDGATALKFVRSRHGNNNEGTDFARAERQQKVILAIKDKMFSLNTILNPTKIKELYDSYSKNVDTNIGLADLQGFYTFSQQVNFKNVKSIVLDDRSSADDGGLLYAPEDTSLYGGAYVLIPRAGDYTQIHAYVQKYIFGK